MKDKNGMLITDGSVVNVPPPEANDLWQHEFTGTVEGFHGEYVVVRDGDGDCWDVEPDKLEISIN